MAWWEWIPFVSTVGHAMADPPGRDVADYASCACTTAECEGLGAPAAVLACEKRIRDQLWKYVLDWIGSGAPSDFAEAALGATAAKFAEALGKALAPKLGPKVAAAGTGVGAALTADGFLDMGIQLRKALQMWEAADKARATYCKCP